MQVRSHWTSLLYAAGLVAVYAGERVVSAADVRLSVTLLGVFAVLGATVWRVVRMQAATADRRKVEQALLGLTVIGLAALSLYFAQSDFFTRWGVAVLGEDSPKLSGVLGALWPLLLVASVLPLLLMEMAYAAMARAPEVEVARVRDAMLSGFGLAGALAFAMSVTYVATERDAKWDLSHFRAARPGEATRKLVQSLEEPVQVSLFFPPANEVGEAVRAYFDDLQQESPKLEVQRFDQAVDVQKARELGVSTNGVVVVGRDKRRETVMVGQELAKSRSQLRSLDQEVQKRLLSLARSRKTIYLTAGHGERLESASSPTEGRAPVTVLRAVLRQQNYDLRPLSAAEGLATEVPKDAAAVLVLGPQSAFAPPEAEVLKAYVEKGGSVLLALDPEFGLSFEELTAPWGLTFTPHTLANDVAHARKSFQPSDRAIIATNTYTSHPSVSTLGRQALPMFLMQAGSLEAKADKAPELTHDFSIKAEKATWNDLNGNFNFDPPTESRKPWNLAAAVVRRAPKDSANPHASSKEGRVLVVTDSDALADEVLQASRGNVYFALDGLKWLMGDEVLVGATNLEEDVPIQRTRGQDTFWFYSTVFLAPAAVLGVGYFASRRRRLPAAKQEARS